MHRAAAQRNAWFTIGADSRPETEVEGPAVVEQLDATTVIPPGYAGRVDDYGNIWITPAG